MVDDESLARESIAVLLKSQSDIGEVYTASEANKALEIVGEHSPDLIFLDIQMPGKTGIQLAAELPETSVIIFATAYNQYAIQAFDLNAIDYLLKPYDDERFYTALDKARARLKENLGNNTKDLQSLVSHLIQEKNLSYKSRLIVKDPGRIRLVAVDDIHYIAGAGNYAEIYLTDGKMVLHRATLTSLEKQLDPSVFIRIHRSTIIRRDSVVELRTNENGDYTVILNSGVNVTMSRRNKSKLGEILGN